MRRRRPIRYGTVAAGMALLAVVIAAVAGALYVRFVRYEPVALRHVPADAALVVRLDVEQAVLYAPVRRHLLPLLVGHGSAADAEATWAAFEEASGLERRDLREIVAAEAASRDDWVLVLGGLFPAGDPARLERGLAGHGFVRAGDGGLVVHPHLGVAAAQAPDGAIVVASSEPAVRRSLEPSAPTPAIPPGIGAFRVTRPHAAVLASAIGVAPSRLEAVAGSARYGERVSLGVSFEPRAVADEAVREALSAVRSLARDRPVTAFLWSGGTRASARATATGEPALELVWEREELDAAFAALAVAIRNGFPAIFGPPVLTRP